MNVNRQSRSLAIIVQALFMVLSLGTAPAASAERGVRYVPGELLVKFRPGVPQYVADEILRGAGAQKLKTFRGDPRLQHVRVPRTWPLESAIAYYSSRADVQYVERNLIYQVRSTPPNDPQFSVQWNWENTGQLGGVTGMDVKATNAWDKATGRFTLVVGVIDTGVDYTHPDLALNIWTNPPEAGVKCTNGIDDGANGYPDDCRGWNFVSGTNDPRDDNDHGTHVAGIIGARGNNSVGVTGANWDVQIMPVKAFDSTGTGSLADIITGIDYALTNGAQVLNNSWGGPGFSQALADAIERANQKGVLFVAAAGGDSGPGTDLDTSGSPFYPCAYTNANVICVAAVTPAGDLSSYSNYGAATVAVGAPGDNITSTIRNQGYGSLSGTSMATPHVTGAVGLIKGCKAGLTASAIKNAILTTTSYLDALNGKVVANGMVNYAAAINSPAVAGTGNCDPSPNNVLPTANAGGPYNSNAKKPIQFNGTGSTDPDGQILLYVWDFGDGGAALGPKPVHQYTASGTYGATLTVRDNLGGISTNTATVTVRPNGKVLGPVSKP